MGFTFGSYFLEIKVPLILIVHVYYMAFWFLSLSLSLLAQSLPSSSSNRALRKYCNPRQDGLPSLVVGNLLQAPTQWCTLCSGIAFALLA